jgi:opacity protein-like surface antigen
MKHANVVTFSRYAAALFAATAMLTAASPAQAQSDTPGRGGYLGIETVNARFSIDSFEPTDEGTVITVPSYDLRGLSLTGGYQFLPNFALEGRLGHFSNRQTVWRWEQENDTRLIPVRAGIDTSVSVLAKGILPLVQNRVQLYGLAGYTRLLISERTPVQELVGITANGWDHSESLAAGADFYVTGNWGFKLEYSRHYRRSSESFDTTHIGALFRF